VLSPQAKAKEHRLYEYDETPEGKINLQQRHRLTLLSNPRNLGRNSRNQGLGVYFLTGIFLVGLLSVLSLIAIFPMANNQASTQQAVRLSLPLTLRQAAPRGRKITHRRQLAPRTPGRTAVCAWEGCSSFKPCVSLKGGHAGSH
jgi:hypothetical protein